MFQTYRTVCSRLILVYVPNIVFAMLTTYGLVCLEHTVRYVDNIWFGMFGTYHSGENEMAGSRKERRARLESKFGTCCAVCSKDNLSGKGLHFAPAESKVYVGFEMAAQCSECRKVSEIEHLRHTTDYLVGKMQLLEPGVALDTQYISINAADVMEILESINAVVTRARLPKGKSVDPMPQARKRP